MRRRIGVFVLFVLKVVFLRYGAISSETAEETLMKCKRGDYLFRFTRSQKGGLMLHVKKKFCAKKKKAKNPFDRFADLKVFVGI